MRKIAVKQLAFIFLLKTWNLVDNSQTFVLNYDSPTTEAFCLSMQLLSVEIQEKWRHKEFLVFFYKSTWLERNEFGLVEDNKKKIKS